MGLSGNMKAKKIMMMFFWLVVAVFIGLQAYVRLAPSNPQDWTIDPSKDAPGAYATAGGYRVVSTIDTDADSFLAAFDNAMKAQPRTRKLAEVDGQHIYISRSLMWGFPDYTTVAFDDGKSRATIYSRLRFGGSDMGVNKKRLQQVLTSIGIDPEG
jgi:uncharacterized protein (DUF1499 family)